MMPDKELEVQNQARCKRVSKVALIGLNKKRPAGEPAGR